MVITCLPVALVVKPGGLRKLVFPERLASGVFISSTHLGGGIEEVSDIFVVRHLARKGAGG